MQVASTIIVAREDFSIPGADQHVTDQTDRPKDERQRFFDLLRQSRPDVVVLNLTVTKGFGVETIRDVRQQSSVPILVVCASADPRTADYRSAGAHECLHPPVDIGLLNRSIRNVIKPSLAEPETVSCARQGYRFAGITYRPDHLSLAGPAGDLVRLEALENAVFRCLVAHSWAVCSRAQLAESAFRDQSSAAQHRVGDVVSRLRKKLELAGGPRAGQLLKTERRRGYTLVADVVG